MSKSHVTATVVLAMTFLAIVGFCVWSVFQGGSTELILGGAIITLGLAQLISFTARDQALTSAMRRVSDIMGAYGALSRELHSVSRRVSTIESYGLLEQQADHGSRKLLQRKPERAPEQDEVAHEPDSTRSTVHATPRAAPQAAPAPAHRSTGGSQHFEEERFDLYLEPIVQIEDGSTRHYRGSLSLRMTDGTRVGMETIQHQATKAGLMPMLDILTVTRVLPVLRRLMQRQRGIGIFCTASAASLADHDFIQKLNSLISDNSDLAKGLIIEVKQQALAELSKEGQEGLARLAELGVTFCLGDADGHGADVQTLSHLGFHYVTMDVMTLANASSKQAEEKLNGFARDASFHSLEVIAGNVSTRTELAAVSTRASLGYGALFSPPRLVRHEIAASSAAAAAA
jgi:cyclic-di-GMP phosphodiesterase, flagellum assembly factor TipF